MAWWSIPNWNELKNSLRNVHLKREIITSIDQNWKCVKFKLENLTAEIFLSCEGYGGTAGNWGEWAWGKVGSFHSQRNTETLIMVSSVLLLTILGLDFNVNKISIWSWEVTLISEEPYIYITLFILILPHSPSYICVTPQDNSFLWTCCLPSVDIL